MTESNSAHRAKPQPSIRGSGCANRTRKTTSCAKLRVILMIAAMASALSLGLPPRADAGGPIWSKKGVTFPVGCSLPDNFSQCKPLRIPSPDGKSAVEVTYETAKRYPGVETVRLRVITLGKEIGEVPSVADVEDEVVWSPDSKAFFINGNNNGYGDDHVGVHMLDQPNLGPGYLTGEVEQDMNRSFPPCKAKNAIDICAQLAADPKGYVGAAAIDWVGDSSHLIIMADIPCTSSLGGIECQVLGYEVQVPSGKILRRMEPKEFARRWQHSMAWKFWDPGPPKFK